MFVRLVEHLAQNALVIRAERAGYRIAEVPAVDVALIRVEALPRADARLPGRCLDELDVEVVPHGRNRADRPDGILDLAGHRRDDSTNVL